jgi:hypothetical protein
MLNRSNDEDNVAVQEQITSQLVEMSPIYQDVVVRHRVDTASSNSISMSQIASNETARIQQQEQQEDAGQPAVSASSTGQAQALPSLTRVLKKIHEHVDQMRYRMQKDTYKRCTNNEWLLVGTLVDRILFFTYCSIVIFCTMAIFKN